MELDEPKPAPVITPSVYQVAVPKKTNTVDENKKAKRFLTYNWEDVNASTKKMDEEKNLGESILPIDLGSPAKQEEKIPEIFVSPGVQAIEVSGFGNEEKESENTTPTQKKRTRKGKATEKVVPK